MSEFSISPSEKSRNAHAAVLRVVQRDGKQGQIATAIGLSDATMSREVNEHLARSMSVLYHAGFKVVPNDMKCFPSADVEAWYAAYKRQIERSETAEQLFGEDV